MERPNINQAERTRQILHQIAVLPDVLSLEVLYRIDYDQLQAVCQGLEEELKSSKNSTIAEKIAHLSYFCSDFGFWISWLIEHGYDLPKGLPKLIEALKYSFRDFKELTDLEVLKMLFFQSDEERDKLFREFGNVFNATHDYPKANWKYSVDQIELITADLYYIWLQINDRLDRKKEKIPRNIRLFLKDPNQISLPDKISTEGLIQFLADNDFISRPESYYNIDLMNRFINEIHLLHISPEISQLFYEQNILVLPFLIREGDWVEFNFINEQDRLVGRYYYVDSNQRLVKFGHLDNLEDYTITFPIEALPFLKKNKINTMADIKKFYPIMSYFDLVSYIEDGKEIDFYETAKERRRRRPWKEENSD